MLLTRRGARRFGELGAVVVGAVVDDDDLARDPVLLENPTREPDALLNVPGLVEAGNDDGHTRGRRRRNLPVFEPEFSPKTSTMSSERAQDVPASRHVEPIEVIQGARPDPTERPDLPGGRTAGEPFDGRPIQRRVEGKAPAAHPEHLEPGELVFPPQLHARVVADVADRALGRAHPPPDGRGENVLARHRGHVAQCSDVIHEVLDDLDAHHQVESFGNCLALYVEAQKTRPRSVPFRQGESLVGDVGAAELVAAEPSETGEVLAGPAANVEDAPDVEARYDA